jgi:hypothetical protein
LRYPSRFASFVTRQRQKTGNAAIGLPASACSSPRPRRAWGRPQRSRWSPRRPRSSPPDPHRPARCSRMDAKAVGNGSIEVHPAGCDRRGRHREDLCRPAHSRCALQLRGLGAPRDRCWRRRRGLGAQLRDQRALDVPARFARCCRHARARQRLDHQHGLGRARR